MVDAQLVKADSERIILEAGGRISEGLPYLDTRSVRPRSEIVGRALVLNAMLQIAFKAQTEVIRDWIARHDLALHLSASEWTLLQKPNSQLSDQESTDLYWYIEALWALLWVGQLIDNLQFDRSIEDYMASLCPRIQDDEDGARFDRNMRTRPYEELFRMLDLHFRLHWWTRDGHLSGYSTGDVSLDIIMERRKALEWVLDPESNWDDVALNT